MISSQLLINATTAEQQLQHRQGKRLSNHVNYGRLSRKSAMVYHFLFLFFIAAG